MIATLALTIAGVVTAIVVKHGNILINATPTSAIHVSVGFIILISCIAQAGLGAYLRNAAYEHIPGLWNKIHGLNGKVLLTLAVSNIPLGMYVYNSRVFVFSGFLYVGLVGWIIFLGLLSKLIASSIIRRSPQVYAQKQSSTWDSIDS